MLYEHSQRCARGLHHLIEKLGGRFGEKCRFSKTNIEFGCPFCLKHFRAWLEKMYLSYLNENDDFEPQKPIMHGYIISHGGDLDENDNFNVRKLIIHDHTW